MRSIEEFDGGAGVVVVGGGVAGLAAARELARRGMGVHVLESGRLGAQATSAAGGMLAPQAEADRRDELFELLCASREAWPSFAEELREESGIDVELDRAGTLYLALTEEDEREVGRRYEWQTREGLEVERLTAREAREIEPEVSPRVRAALRFPRDWQVENRLLVRALAESAARFGVRFSEGTAATSVRVIAGRAAGVETSRGFAPAGAVVLAAGAWASRVPLMVTERDTDEARAVEGAHPAVEPVRGQMLCFARPRESGAFVRHVVYSPRGYVVPRRDGRLLAGSTTERADFDCSVTPEGLSAVTSHAVEIAPRLASLTLADSWAGLRPRSEDGLPVLGESAACAGLFYATGYYRNGILLAPAAARIVADMVTGVATTLPPRALEAFSPARFGRTLAASRAE